MKYYIGRLILRTSFFVVSYILETGIIMEENVNIRIIGQKET